MITDRNLTQFIERDMATAHRAEEPGLAEMQEVDVLNYLQKDPVAQPAEVDCPWWINPPFGRPVADCAHWFDKPFDPSGEQPMTAAEPTSERTSDDI